jgi:2-polyprenyl-3-methyl-5-hydroxy-6-metoxy-1,4-benzoquinol methylase
MAHERGARVLDLACGSGRLSIPLAKAGLQVVGGDLSSEMLQRARRSAETQSIELDLIQLDVRDFDAQLRP